MSSRLEIPLTLLLKVIGWQITWKMSKIGQPSYIKLELRDLCHTGNLFVPFRRSIHRGLFNCYSSCVHVFVEKKLVADSHSALSAVLET